MQNNFRIIGCFLLLINYSILLPSIFGQSPITTYGKEITTRLCSPSMEGRGYVNEGCSKAAQFILNEFNRLGLEPLNGYSTQPFYLDVNTFPRKCKVKFGLNKKSPGIDYLIHPSSAGYKGRLSIIPLTAAEVLKYTFGREGQQGKAVAFIPRAGMSNDTIKMVRTKLEKLARTEIAVVEFTREKLTWSVSNEQFKYPYIQYFDTVLSRIPTHIKLSVEANIKHDYSVENVFGYVKSKTPSDSFIIVCAHYDHLGRMGKKTYFPGANDNASGVAMMLGIAKSIKQQALANHSVLFIGFAGEEIGLQGSQFFVNQHILGASQISLVLNLDIMGSGEEGITVVNGSIHPGIFQRLVKINESTQSINTIKARGKAANSDHYPFSQAGIPAIFIYSMGPNKNYHDVHDKSEALSFARFDEIQYLILRLLQTF